MDNYTRRVNYHDQRYRLELRRGGDSAGAILAEIAVNGHLLDDMLTPRQRRRIRKHARREGEDR